MSIPWYRCPYCHHNYRDLAFHYHVDAKCREQEWRRLQIVKQYEEVERQKIESQRKLTMEERIQEAKLEILKKKYEILHNQTLAKNAQIASARKCVSCGAPYQKDQIRCEYCLTQLV